MFLVFCHQWNMMSDLNMSREKISDFVSFLLFGFPSVLKLGNFDFESHWNTLIFLIKIYMTSDLNMSHGKMSGFVSFPLFGFTLVVKLRNFDIWSHWNTSIFFWSKQKRCQICICPLKQFWIWFKLCCLNKHLTISWEIWILNFVEIV